MQQSALDIIAADTALASVSSDIARLTRLALRIAASPVARAQLPVGASRFGGAPDVPPHFAWPALRAAPLAFLAQLDLAEVAAALTNAALTNAAAALTNAAAPGNAAAASGTAPAHALPAAGSLLFFYDAQRQTYGADPADRDGWRVLYHAGDPRQLARVTPPPALPPAAQLPPCALTFAPELCLPPPEMVAALGLHWPDATIARYEQLLGTAETEAERRAPHHRLLGYPEQLQDELLAQAALVSRGLTDPEAPRAAAALAHAHDWQLLLQLDSDDAAGMRWGSAGMLDFLITQRALHTATFAGVWCVLQSE